MLRSSDIDKILPAIALVKAKLVGVTKGSDNPFFKSKYADLNTHLDEVEPLLQENGLVLMQPPVAEGEGNTVESIIFHTESGQYLGSSMNLVGEKDMQKAGSAVTYARRYTLGGLLSIKSLDDDGNSASGKESKKTSSYTKREPAPKAAASTKTESETKAPSKKSGFRKPKKTNPAPAPAAQSDGDDW